MLLSNLVYLFLIIILAINNSKIVSSDVNKITYKDTLILLFLSVFTIFLSSMIYYYILKNHDSSIISALIYSSPVFTLIIAHLFLNERLNIYGISGIFAIIIGVILISQNNQIKSGKN
uniref:EamA domain-containing protein n=1 Tax=viral metagenome TaxID=1070528 RepID=A0A6C0KUA5_9ZZZZ